MGPLIIRTHFLKQLLLFFLLLTLMACGKPSKEECGGSKEEVSGVGCVDLEGPVSPSHKNLVIDPLTGVPNEALTFETNLELSNFNYEEMEKALAAADLIRQVVASPEFRDEIINHTVDGVRTFVDNQGLTNGEIYQIILEGSEKLNPGRNNSLDVKLRLYYEENNIIGYTYSNSEYIWLNRNYFSWYTPAQVSGNLFHEWLHKLGFMHSYEYTETRKNSVPYAIGYIMGRLARNHM